MVLFSNSGVKGDGWYAFIQAMPGLWLIDGLTVKCLFKPSVFVCCVELLVFTIYIRMPELKPWRGLEVYLGAGICFSSVVKSILTTMIQLGW